MWCAGEEDDFRYRGELLHSPVRVFDREAGVFSERRFPLRHVARLMEEKSGGCDVKRELIFDAGLAARVRHFMCVNAHPCDDVLPLGTQGDFVITLYVGRCPESSFLRLHVREAQMCALRLLIGWRDEPSALRLLETFPIARLDTVYEGVSLLSMAIACGASLLAEALLDRGARGGGDDPRWSPLAVAARGASPLVRRCAPLADEAAVRAAVLEATMRGDCTTLSAMRDAGVCIDFAELHGATMYSACLATKLALNGGDLEICSFLLSCAPPDALRAAVALIGRADGAAEGEALRAVIIDAAARNAPSILVEWKEELAGERYSRRLQARDSSALCSAADRL